MAAGSGSGGYSSPDFDAVNYLYFGAVGIEAPVAAAAPVAPTPAFSFFGSAFDDESSAFSFFGSAFDESPPPVSAVVWE